MTDAAYERTGREATCNCGRGNRGFHHIGCPASVGQMTTPTQDCGCPVGKHLGSCQERERTL